MDISQNRWHLNREKFVEGCLRGRTFRIRYTLLEYLYQRGGLEAYVEAAYNEVVLNQQ
ncbi:MAG: hypothetical protein U0L92_00615 [Clostridia bacterium]|nr:hypothetical protein [Clostridia bacterium]